MARPAEIENLEAAYKEAHRAYVAAVARFEPRGDKLIAEARSQLTRLEKLLREYEDGRLDCG